jgi:hypothetical protein
MATVTKTNMDMNVNMDMGEGVDVDVDVDLDMDVGMDVGVDKEVNVDTDMDKNMDDFRTGELRRNFPIISRSALKEIVESSTKALAPLRRKQKGHRESFKALALQ